MVEVLPLRVRAVVGHAGLGPGLVGAVAALEPGEAGAQVLGDAEPQAVLLRRLLPLADHVAFRAHVDGVPLVELRVPQEEIVVVRAHADEVLRPGLLVELHQTVGVPLLRLPQRDDVLVAELRRMPVVLEVILVMLVARLVHAAGVPVAVHRHGLRSPVRPDAELGVAEPVGTLVLLERIHVRLERAVRNGVFAHLAGPRPNAGQQQTDCDDSFHRCILSVVEFAGKPLASMQSGGVALGWPWDGFGVALGAYEGRMKVACGWLAPPKLMACRWLVGGLR